VDGEHVVAGRGRDKTSFVEIDAPLPATVPDAILPPGGLNQDAAHRFRGGGEEVPAAVPVLRLFIPDEAEVRLVDHGPCLTRLPRLLARHLRGGEVAPLVVDRR